MGFEFITLKPSIIINKICTIHYFEYMSDFSFAGEAHNFWEFLCVDKGEVNVVAGSRSYSLKKDDIIFHKPNEFHSVQSNGLIAPNLVVITFECNSPAMSFFQEKILTIGESERNLLAQIIMESRNVFTSPLDDPYLTRMERTEDSPFGCEQMIKLHLEQLLIQMVRRYTALHIETQGPKVLKERSDNDLYTRIQHYLELHLYNHLTIEQICKDNLVGRSQLQKLFREHNSCGVIDYFTKMKITLAKQLIRNKQLNFTQISDTLGYTSIHYFSRQFKKITGMTPSEYSSSIKKLSEPPIVKI
ncbi:MAG: AraC family transcriptional regulator [Lachnospiraceae bacterium]|nr:AraC family transcriptional regulator [Lachnospiraceae bacterium]